MNNYKIIDTTQAADFNAALELHHQVTGEHFYAGYENVKQRELDAIEKEPNAYSDWHVCSEKGDIFYVYTCPDGLKILHELDISVMISNGGFNEATVYPSNTFIGGRNWGNTPANRKVFIKENITVTSLAA